MPILLSPLPSQGEASEIGRQQPIFPTPPAGDGIPLGLEEPALPALAPHGLLEEPLPLLQPEEPEVRLPDRHGIDPGRLELTNRTDGIDCEISDYWQRPLSLSVDSAGPQILIMHTHGTEAYTMADGDDYIPSDTARTTDKEYNMIRVGAEVKAVLEARGYSVLHDTTLYDHPSYNGSYARAMEGIQGYLEEYPTISIVLDIHRDALIDADGTAYPRTAQLSDGSEAAQVMLVMGSSDSGLAHPNWQENLAFAAQIQGQLLAMEPALPRPIQLRSQRFNQHLTTGSLLAEIGTSGNTLQQALAGARLFALGLSGVLDELRLTGVS